MAAVFLFVTTCQTHDDNLLEKKLTVWRQTSFCTMATIDLTMFRAPQTASQKHQSGSRRVTDN